MYHIVLRYPSDHPQREEIDGLVIESLGTVPSEIPENVSSLLKFLFSSSRKQPNPQALNNYFVRKAFLHRMLLIDAESGVQSAVVSEVHAQYDDAILSLGILMLSKRYDNNLGDDETRSITELAMEAYMGRNAHTDADDTVMRRVAALAPGGQSVVPSGQQTKSASQVILYCRSLWLYNFDINFTLCRPSIFTTSGYSTVDPPSQRIDGALSEQLLFALEPLVNIISQPTRIWSIRRRQPKSRLQIEKHPSLLHHITSELMVAGNHKAIIRWMGLFMVNPEKWIFDSDGDINPGWVQSGLSASIVSLVKDFRNPLVIVCFLFETLRSIQKTSKFAGSLVRDGFVEAAVWKMNAVGSSSLQKILLIDLLLSVHRLSVANMKSVWDVGKTRFA
ncbi:hypothetical protein FS837_000594 [Tulasnella sp. UAMH 9824]|nr:hypothetical protein FS837_000594 [Tulasnella sp. UAMH 9824]